MPNKKTNKRIILISGILIAGFLIGGFWIYRNGLDKHLKEDPQESVNEQNNTEKQQHQEQESTKKSATEGTNTNKQTEEIVEPTVDSIENKLELAETVEETAESKNLSPVYLAQSKSLFNPANTSIENLPAGKAYFQGENGKLESIVNKKEDGISEQLVSYDYHGQKADALEIGWIDDAGQTVKYAVILGNKISIFETIKTKKKTETKVTEYAITPQLKFIKGKAYTRLM